MSTTPTLRLVGAGLVSLALVATGSAAANAKGGNDVRKSGSCSATSTWKLKAKPDNGRIELEAEVDSNHVGQVWDWTIKHDGGTATKGSGTTHGASGSFTVKRRMSDKAGTDHFVFRAERRATGAVCRGTVSL